MNANELADDFTKNVLNWQDYHKMWEWMNQASAMLRQQQERILELEACINDCYKLQKMQADECYKVQAENNAFRKELFKIGSMRSCSQAAALHGFVSPAQAGDDAREYIAEILRNAQDK